MLQYLLALAMSLFVFQASACEKELLSILQGAQQKVTQTFKVGETCYNAAIIGRSKGLPNCYPPEALTLKKLLTPTFKKAETVCKNVCPSEKTKSCNDLLAQKTLKQLGIQGLMQKIKTKGLSTDVHFESIQDDFYSLPTEI